MRYLSLMVLLVGLVLSVAPWPEEKLSDDWNKRAKVMAEEVWAMRVELETAQMSGDTERIAKVKQWQRRICDELERRSEVVRNQ